MAAEHGIPHRLPQLPSVTPKETEQKQQSKSDPVAELKTLSKNYLNMLASNPKETMSDNTTAAGEAPLDLDMMLNDILQESSSTKDPMSTNGMGGFPVFANAFNATTQQSFLTSPLLGDYDSSSPLFGAGIGLDFTSPAMTADPSDLTSPLFNDAHEFGTSPLLADNGSNFDIPLFGEAHTTPQLVNDTSPLLTDSHSSPQLSTPQNAVVNFDASITEHPSLFSSIFDASLYGGIHPAATLLPNTTVEQEKPTEPISEPTPAPVVKPRRTQNRKVIATGTRKNLKPELLLGEDAPTQTRKYALPSSTSKKDMPVTFARKRVAQAIANDEDDFLPDLPPNATEREQIEWKRRQNTIAARKSRKRKLEHQQWLETEVERLQRDRDLWKVRAMTLRGVMKSKGEDSGMDEWDDGEE